ncbi:rab proteins geranylgeranyltransferase component A 1 isoform X2 [Rana temporaria]|uniref:rab proteins geranylgeranyltransferase component A 1 isoform X2 n=1 Tax=Rana temporaria TaxID=8407 RepID=UPI001AADCE34|nr:rab proteins geranylgeranyltransferase component A 1 isoform X2 [Rana temporaria]
MAADLPAEFDVVILGTGLPESIVAAACSRIGQRVLHLDARNYYGGNWASFTFSGLQSWIDEHKRDVASEEPDAGKEHVLENEGIVPLNRRGGTVRNVEVFSYSKSKDSDVVEEVGALSIKPQLLNTDPTDSDQPLQDSPAHEESVPQELQDPESGSAEHREVTSGSDQTPSANIAPPTPESGDAPDTEPSAAKVCQTEPKKSVTYSDIVREGRRFNIDLVSKFLYSRGLLIDLLIKSNVSRYTEFKNVTRILTYHKGRIEQVPCSRADVFSSKQLSMIEKRTLMKFLTFCADYEQHIEEYQDHKDSTFAEFLQAKRLTPSLQHFVLCAIAMVSKNTNTVDGLKATQHFLQCLGRYGNTPFLFHLYGLGEIPQCFCRMSAVFGGIYCLHHSLQCLVIDEESKRCTAVIDSSGKRISCNYVLVEDGYLTEETCAQVQYRQISRAVLITDSSVLRSESDQEISVLTVPSEDGHQNAVYMTELCSSTNTCIKNTYLVHLSCSSMKATAREDLEPVIRKLFVLDGEEDPESVERPRVLWLLYFNMRDSSMVERQSYVGLPSNVFVCSGPDPCFGYDHSVQQAENTFTAMYPSEEFCPPAPNPEDIIYDGEGAQPDASEAGAAEESKEETPSENVTEEPKTE